jgi:hypothetical protein
MVMKYVNWALRRSMEAPKTPVCPDHHVDMLLRGMVGRPARFSRQTEGEYTHIYFCPVEGCNETAERKIATSQAPFPGEAPDRPIYARNRPNVRGS